MGKGNPFENGGEQDGAWNTKRVPRLKASSHAAPQPVRGPLHSLCLPTTPRTAAFVDPYERINFWSHAVPATGLLVLGLRGWLRGELSVALYCGCAAVTHGLSALTHVFPESVALVRRAGRALVERGRRKWGKSVLGRAPSS